MRSLPELTSGKQNTIMHETRRISIRIVIRDKNNWGINNDTLRESTEDFLASSRPHSPLMFPRKPGNQFFVSSFYSYFFPVVLPLFYRSQSIFLSIFFTCLRQLKNRIFLVFFLLE